MELALLDFDNTLTNSNGVLLDETIQDIKKYTKENKICIISNSTYNELLKIKNDNLLDISFYSLSNNMGLIDNKLVKSDLDYHLINEIINNFKDFIYTLWANDSSNSFIYNYQDRLSFFYPKENRIIINEFIKNIPSISIAINIGCYDEFYSFIEKLNLGYEIIAKDSKRNIVKIFNLDHQKNVLFNKIINYFKPDKTIGIGDGIDNLSFINLCDEKIAMKDSILAKELKKTTTKTNDFNGCLDYLINR